MIALLFLNLNFLQVELTKLVIRIGSLPGKQLVKGMKVIILIWLLWLIANGKLSIDEAKSLAELLFLIFCMMSKKNI